MSLRTLPPFRADHVGSLLRPRELLDARARHRAGELDDAGLREAEDTAIRAAVALQRDAGVRTATDGEFRRTSWHMDFIYQLEGVDPTDQKLAVHFHNKGGDLDFESAALSVHDRVGLGHTIFGDAFAFLRDSVTKGTPKLTIPSPSMVHYRGGRAAIDESVYPDLEPSWADLNAAGMLWGHTVRSPHAHARVVDIDISRAVAMPGVHAVLTHADVPGRNRYGLEFPDQPVLAFERVRYFGEPVALVAAEHPEQARRAADRINVEYEPLEPVIDPERATEQEPIHDDEAFDEASGGT